MAFHEVQFPPEISFGAAGGPGFKTTIVTLESGHERRNIDWSAARGEWDVQHGLKSQAYIDALIAFFRAREGMAHGFRFKDWSDYQLARQTIGATDGATATFQIFKRYSSLVDYDRAIAKPVAGTVAVWVNAVAISEGGGASQFTVDPASGVITLGGTLAAQTGTAVEATCEFDVPVRGRLLTVACRPKSCSAATMHRPFAMSIVCRPYQTGLWRPFVPKSSGNRC